MSRSKELLPRTIQALVTIGSTAKPGMAKPIGIKAQNTTEWRRVRTGDARFAKTLCLMEKRYILTTKCQLKMAVRTKRKISFTYTKLAIIKCIGWEAFKVADGLSRLMGQLSRAVLRGEGHGDVFPLTRLTVI